MISMRFLGEDSQVSVTEFLEYMSTPIALREAKSAVAAVRMSLEFLQIDDVKLSTEKEATTRSATNDENVSPVRFPTRNT